MRLDSRASKYSEIGLVLKAYCCPTVDVKDSLLRNEAPMVDVVVGGLKVPFTHLMMMQQFIPHLERPGHISWLLDCSTLLSARESEIRYVFHYKRLSLVKAVEAVKADKDALRERTVGSLRAPRPPIQRERKP